MQRGRPDAFACPSPGGVRPPVCSREEGDTGGCKSGKAWGRPRWSLTAAPQDASLPSGGLAFFYFGKKVRRAGGTCAASGRAAKWCWPRKKFGPRSSSPRPERKRANGVLSSLSGSDGQSPPGGLAFFYFGKEEAGGEGARHLLSGWPGRSSACPPLSFARKSTGQKKGMSTFFQTRAEVEAHLPTIRPRALKLALETRETIAMTRRICGNKADAPIAELRRCTLEMIASAKKQERNLRTALDSGLYD